LQQPDSVRNRPAPGSHVCVGNIPRRINSRHPDRSAAQWRDPRRVPQVPRTWAPGRSPPTHSRSRSFFSQKPQQNRVSSPCAPEKSHNQHSINHFRHENSWHSSYAPLGTINIWIEFIQPARVVSPEASRTESIFWRQLKQNQYFVGVTRARTAFSAITRIFSVFYPQVPYNQYIARRSPHNCMIPNHLLINYLLSISCL